MRILPSKPGLQPNNLYKYYFTKIKHLIFKVAIIQKFKVSFDQSPNLQNSLLEGEQYRQVGSLTIHELYVKSFITHK